PLERPGAQPRGRRKPVAPPEVGVVRRRPLGADRLVRGRGGRGGGGLGTARGGLRGEQRGGPVEQGRHLGVVPHRAAAAAGKGGAGEGRQRGRQEAARRHERGRRERAPIKPARDEGGGRREGLERGPSADQPRDGGG